MATRRWLSPGRLSAFAATIAIVYFLLLPLVMLVIGAVRTSPYGTAGVWTLEGFATVLRDPRTLSTLAATFVYAVCSTAGCMLLGLWFVTAATRMATPLRHLIMPAMVVLVATPRLFYALSWGMLGNPNSGLFARAAFGGRGADPGLDDRLQLARAGDGDGAEAHRLRLSPAVWPGQPRGTQPGGCGGHVRRAAAARLRRYYAGC